MHSDRFSFTFDCLTIFGHSETGMDLPAVLSKLRKDFLQLGGNS